jgi:hypothetical protein
MSFGDTLFKSTCTEIERLNKYWQAKQKMPPHELLIDPIDGEQSVAFIDSNGKRISPFISDPELVQAASSLYLPAFPLPDTLWITDTTGILSASELKIGRHYFLIHRCLVTTCNKHHASAGSMYLQPTIISENKIYLRFSFAGSDELFYCEFRMINGVPIFRRSTMQKRFIRTDKYPRIE